MNFIKRHFIKKYITDNKPVRDINIVSLQKAKTVGLICNITTEDTYKEIYAVFSNLHNANRAVWLMGYINDKEVPFYCLPQFTAEFFCNKDLNWYGRLEKPLTKEFAEKDFDILIDFSHEPFDAIRLIMSISRAHFIVGAQKDNAPYYDLLINSEEELSHADLLKHVETYTKKLSGETAL